MARTPSIATRQAPPPPEPEVTDDTVYNEIWTTVAAYKPDEADQGDGESDQDYFKRLSQAIADITEPDADGNSEIWSAMSQPAQQWYDATVSAAEAGEEYPAPDGFYATEDEAEAEPEPEPEPEPAPKAKSGREALMAFNAKRKADKEAAAAASNGGSPAAPVSRRMTPVAAPAPRAPAPRAPAPAVAAPGRRMAPVAAPAAPAAKRAAPALPARAMPVRPAAPGRAAPAKKAAAPPRAPAMEKPKSGVEIIRELIITNPQVTADQIIEYMVENHQVEPKKSTVVSLMTSTRTAINTIKNLGYWNDNAA